jgi:hypothetical protein
VLLAPPHSAAARFPAALAGGPMPDGETLRTRRPGARQAAILPAPAPIPAPPAVQAPPAGLIHSADFPSRTAPATPAAADDTPTQAIPALRQAPPRSDTSEILPSGLPQRRPGEPTPPGDDKPARTTGPNGSGLLDPEAVRVRLSGLAGGIAAAHRELAREQRLSAPPATKESTR